jgi:hypothetical protein
MLQAVPTSISTTKMIPNRTFRGAVRVIRTSLDSLQENTPCWGPLDSTARRPLLI